MYAFLPGWTIAFNDDFAYLRSVVETVQHGRPWTNGFLEPWSYSLSGASALLYRLTNSFTVATLGLQIGLPLVSFFFAAHFVWQRTRSVPIAVGLCAAILLFPTMLWKQAEFTAMVVYLPALFVALWCAANEKWGAFFIAFAVALASRQSAIAWLALPFGAAVTRGFTRRITREVLLPVSAILAGALWFIVISRTANETHAQRLITGSVLRSIEMSVFVKNACIAFGVAATAAGVVELVLRLYGYRAAEERARLIERTLGAAVALGLFASIPSIAASIPLSFEHPLFDSTWAPTFLRGLVILGALGWVLRPPRIAFPYAFAAAGALGLASVRSQVWDYYLIDGVVFTIGATLIPSGTKSPRRDSNLKRQLLSALGAFVLVTILGAELAASGTFKRSLDERAGFCAVLEKALRAGWMKPTELSHAPFGFVAWHLFPYYEAHDGAASADLAGFGAYVAERAVDVRVEPITFNAPDDHPRPFAEVRPHGWFHSARFSLDRRTDTRPPRIPIDWSSYEYPMFPLNDAEWNEVIHSAERASR